MDDAWRGLCKVPNEAKKAPGYAACSTPRIRVPSLARKCQFEGFGIKSYSEIETVLAELKCYISAEQLQMNGQDLICSYTCATSGKGKGRGYPKL